MKFILFLCGLFFAVTVHAETSSSPTSEELISRLEEAMQLSEMLDQTLTQNKSATKQQLEDLVEKKLSSIPPLTDAESYELSYIFDEYLRIIFQSIDTEHAANLYLSELSTSLNANDLKQSLAFYRSEPGKKFRQAEGKAASKMNDYINTQVNAQVRGALPKIMLQLGGFFSRVEEKGAGALSSSER